jgi:hypothetical protein
VEEEKPKSILEIVAVIKEKQRKIVESGISQVALETTVEASSTER